MTPRRTKSDKPKSIPVNRIRQSGKRDDTFAERFSEALAGRDRAWLARVTGLSASTLHDYSRGAVPSADRAFAIADALGVDARWLVTGEGEGPGASSGDWVRLPYRSLLKEAEPADEHGGAPVRREWLRRAFGRTDDLWLTDMPSQSFPEIAREGDPIVCVDASRMVEGSLYLVEMEMGVVVRRLAATTAGHVLTTDASVAEGGAPAFAHPSGPRLLGRILGTLIKAV